MKRTKAFLITYFGLLLLVLMSLGPRTASAQFWLFKQTYTISDDIGNNAKITQGQCNGKTVITNDGAGAARTYILPTPEEGAICRVYLEEAYDVDLDPNSPSEQIYTLTDSAGDKISSDAVQGSCITLVAYDATGWWPLGWVGAWADAN